MKTVATVAATIPAIPFTFGGSAVVGLSTSTLGSVTAAGMITAGSGGSMRDVCTDITSAAVGNLVGFGVFKGTGPVMGKLLGHGGGSAASGALSGSAGSLASAQYTVGVNERRLLSGEEALTIGGVGGLSGGVLGYAFRGKAPTTADTPEVPTGRGGSRPTVDAPDAAATPRPTADTDAAPVKPTGDADAVAPSKPAGENAVAQRQAENAEYSKTHLQEDAKKVGVTENQLEMMRNHECPLSFDSPEQFNQFQKEVTDALQRASLSDVTLRMKGTSTTFYSENPKKPLGHHFDKDPSAPADVDIGIESPGFVQQMHDAGMKPHPDIPAIFKTRDMMKVFPELQEIVDKWSNQLGREVNFVGSTNPANPPASPSDYVW